MNKIASLYHLLSMYLVQNVYETNFWTTLTVHIVPKNKFLNIFKTSISKYCYILIKKLKF